MEDDESELAFSVRLAAYDLLMVSYLMAVHYLLIIIYYHHPLLMDVHYIWII